MKTSDATNVEASKKNGGKMGISVVCRVKYQRQVYELK